MGTQSGYFNLKLMAQINISSKIFIQVKRSGSDFISSQDLYNQMKVKIVFYWVFMILTVNRSKFEANRMYGVDFFISKISFLVVTSSLLTRNNPDKNFFGTFGWTHTII